MSSVLGNAFLNDIKHFLLTDLDLNQIFTSLKLTEQNQKMLPGYYTLKEKSEAVCTEVDSKMKDKTFDYETNEEDEETPGSCTQSQIDMIPSGHDPEWTRSQMDTIPNERHPERTRFFAKVSANFLLCFAKDFSLKCRKIVYASQLLLLENCLLHSFAKSAIMYFAATFR